MSRARLLPAALFSAALCVASAGILRAQPAPPPPPPPPGGAPMGLPPMIPPMPRMMTEDSEYCGHLNDEIGKLHDRLVMAPPELRDLADEGSRMCDHGEFRGGIRRLRRVIWEMRHGF